MVKQAKMRVARTRNGGTWTEARFWGFLRSVLRRLSLRWHPRKLAEIEARRPSESANKRLKWEYRCANCGGWHPRKNMEINHIEPAGSLRSFDDLPGFCARLFCEADGFEALCKQCHQEQHKGGDA